MKNIRSLFELINEYPWTTIFMCWFVFIIVATIVKGLIYHKKG